MSYFDDTINFIEDSASKDRNCIPFGFNRFAEDLEGLTKSTYTIITASSGIGKSKYAIAMYVINVIDFLIEQERIGSKSTIDAHIIYFCLEESRRKFYLSLQCNLLYKQFGIRIGVKDLKSLGDKSKRKVNADIISKLKSLKGWFDVFEQKVEVIDNIRNTYGLYKYQKEYALSVGKLVKEKQIVEHKEKDVEIYVPNNPDMYLISILDQITLIQKQKDQPTQWEAIQKYSSDHCIELRNIFGYSINNIQQQEASKEKQEYYKGTSIESKLEPSLDGLGIYKNSQQDADIVLGLFAPDRYEMQKHEGYNILKLGDHYRSLKILKNRDGDANTKIGLFFDGATLDFHELPTKKELEENPRLYDEILKKTII